MSAKNETLWTGARRFLAAIDWWVALKMAALLVIALAVLSSVLWWIADPSGLAGLFNLPPGAVEATATTPDGVPYSVQPLLIRAGYLSYGTMRPTE